MFSKDPVEILIAWIQFLKLQFLHIHAKKDLFYNKKSMHFKLKTVITKSMCWIAEYFIIYQMIYVLSYTSFHLILKISL